MFRFNIILFLILGLLCLIPAIADEMINAEHERVILQLESQISEKLDKAISNNWTELDLYVSVHVVTTNAKEEVTALTEKNTLDYLPLVAREGLLQHPNSLYIKRYDLKVVSLAKLTPVEKLKIESIIEGELEGRSYQLNYSVIDDVGFLHKLTKLSNSFFKSELFWLALYFVSSLGVIIVVGLALFKLFALVKIRKSKLNKVGSANVEELISFVKNTLSENSTILKKVVQDEEDDILGVKSLIPYLESLYPPEQIFPKSILIRVANESRFSSEKDFARWLQKFSERVTEKKLKTIVKEKAPLAVAKPVEHVSEVIDTVPAPVKPLSENPHEKVSNDDIDDIINQLLAGKASEEAASLLRFTKDNLTQLPSSYIEQKLERRNVKELAKILKPLSDGSRYFMISCMSEQKSTEVVKAVDAMTPSDENPKYLNGFLDEINNDYVEGKFLLDENKAA